MRTAITCITLMIMLFLVSSHVEAIGLSGYGFGFSNPACEGVVNRFKDQCDANAPEDTICLVTCTVTPLLTCRCCNKGGKSFTAQGNPFEQQITASAVFVDTPVSGQGAEQVSIGIAFSEAGDKVCQDQNKNWSSCGDLTCEDGTPTAACRIEETGMVVTACYCEDNDNNGECDNGQCIDSDQRSYFCTNTTNVGPLENPLCEESYTQEQLDAGVWDCQQVNN